MDIVHSKADGNIVARLRRAGLRPTRQRIALGTLLFAQGDRHVTAERLHEEALLANVQVSLATVYNTLHQFTEAGLLKELAVCGTKTVFDTNTSDHYHYVVEPDGRIEDVPSQNVRVIGLPELPEGTRIDRIDVVIRLARED